MISDLLDVMDENMSEFTNTFLTIAKINLETDNLPETLSDNDKMVI